ncbi:MAG: hypothetical protein GY740_18330, partial [Gammaproteobacteria bacterium]|nr:hypothetical protein [Gammaproteobacteria bacterium]
FALPDTGASPPILVPSDLLPEIYKGRFLHLADNWQPTPDGRILQVEGTPLKINGWLYAWVTVCGQQIRTPIYICPFMSKADGVIIGCHALRRLGFSLLGPDGVDYLGKADTRDNTAIQWEHHNSLHHQTPRAASSSNGGEGAGRPAGQSRQDMPADTDSSPLMETSFSETMAALSSEASQRAVEVSVPAGERQQTTLTKDDTSPSAMETSPASPARVKGKQRRRRQKV